MIEVVFLLCWGPGAAMTDVESIASWSVSTPKSRRLWSLIEKRLGLLLAGPPSALLALTYL